jgi:tetratricopeptide (TPR) repeat protein
VRALALLLLLPLLAPAAASATDSAARLDEALASYAQALETRDRDLRLERFRQAARAFADVVAEGHRSPDLYTNLGNSALQAERLGDAVLAYRRALALDPDHARALQNLEHARTLLPAWVPRPEQASVLDSFFFWHRTFSRAERGLGSALAFAAAALLFALALRSDSTSLRNAALIPSLAWLGLLASLLLDPAAGAANDAVVRGEEVVARAADSAGAPSLLPAPLPGGTEVEIVERRTPWLRTRLANGRDVWLPTASVAPVADPG